MLHTQITIVDHQRGRKRSGSCSLYRSRTKLAKPMDDACWICLENGTEQNPVMMHCKCPRPLHKACLARWQIQQLGRSEEKCCRFCNTQLPNWCDALMPPARTSQPETDDNGAPETTAVMAVVFNNKVHKVPVRPGPDGEAEFKACVKTLFGFPYDMEFDVTFEVKLPTVGGTVLPATTPDTSLVLRGLNQFGSAAMCAHASAMARSMEKDMVMEKAT